MAKKLKPVDLSFLKDFTFVGGGGDYEKKEVCIMSGLRLAVAIAEEEITLAEAIDPNHARYIPEQDRVDCVHDLVRSLAIEINDSLPDDKRKPWALATLPRLLGTKRGGMQATIRAERAMEIVSTEFHTNIAIKLAQKFIETEDPHYLYDALAHMKREIDLSDEEDLELSIAKLEAALSVLQPPPPAEGGIGVKPCQLRLMSSTTAMSGSSRTSNRSR